MIIDQSLQDMAPLGLLESKAGETMKFSSQSGFLEHPPYDNQDDIDQGEKVPHKGPFCYFINIGFVIYGAQYVLVDRQIVPFCNFSSRVWRGDIRYRRGAVKVLAEQVKADGVPLLSDNVPDIGGFGELHSSSYLASYSPEGVEGFLGRHYSETRYLKATDWKVLLGLARSKKFPRLHNEGDSTCVWPTFYIKIKNQKVPGAVEMWDTEAQQWEWVIDLDCVAPIVLGYPMQLPDETLMKIRERLDTCLQFLGPVYIGMRNIRPYENLNWRPGEMPSGVLKAWTASKIKADQLVRYMQELELRFDAWAYPAPISEGTTARFEKKVLNEHALNRIKMML